MPAVKRRTQTEPSAHLAIEAAHSQTRLEQCAPGRTLLQLKLLLFTLQLVRSVLHQSIARRLGNTRYLLSGVLVRIVQSNLAAARPFDRSVRLRIPPSVKQPLILPFCRPLGEQASEYHHQNNFEKQRKLL